MIPRETSTREKVVLFTHTVRWALRIVWESNPRLCLASVVLVLVQGIVPVVNLYVTKLLVDAVAALVVDNAPRWNGLSGGLYMLMAAIALTALLSALCRSLSTLLSEAQGEAVSELVYKRLHEQSIALDLDFYDNMEYHDTLHRAQYQAPSKPVAIVNALVQSAQDAFSLLAVAGVIAVLDWRILPALVLVLVAEGWLRARIAGKRYAWTRAHTSDERKAWYLNLLLTTEIHAKEVRLFNLGPLLAGRFQTLRDQLRKERLELARERMGHDFAAQTVSIVAGFFYLLLAAQRTVVGAISIGSMVMFYQAFQRAQQYVQSILRSCPTIYEDSLFLSDLSTLLGLEASVKEPPAPIPFPQPIKQGVVFDHVSFGYPRSDARVLDDVCIAIRPGEMVALVGENGAGKTTLVKLLCRLFDVQEGSITIDGIDLRDMEIADLRTNISAIFQDYAKYHLTARDNIALGDVRLSSANNRVETAATNAGAHEFLEALPRGYDSYLGKWFEAGEELSIGQWQRVAIARAFMRDAPIVVFDEPTSALDPKMEHLVVERLRALAAGRACLIVSHRMSTARMADRLYVLDRGRVIETGSHDELMELNGQYARLFMLQSSQFLDPLANQR